MPPQTPIATAVPTPSQPPTPPATAPPVAAAPIPPVEPQLNPAYAHHNLATASLILGIVSLPASILNILTLPIPITGLVLGIVSLKSKKNFALAGIILSILGVILSGVVLVVGLHIEHNKPKTTAQTSTASSSQVVTTGSAFSTACFRFSMPSVFKASDLQKSGDCAMTLINSDSSDDLSVTAYAPPQNLTTSTKDSYLKNVVGLVEGQVANSIQVTSSKFITVDGARAYELIGTENSGPYKYINFLAVVSPQSYVSSTGANLQAFVLAADSTTTPDRVSQFAQNWKWQ